MAAGGGGGVDADVDVGVGSRLGFKLGLDLPTFHTKLLKHNIRQTRRRLT